jgi:hypothetical protein
MSEADDIKDKYERVAIYIRVPKWMRKALKEKIPKNQMSETFRRMIQDWLTAHGDSIPVDAEALMAEWRQKFKETKSLENESVHYVLKLMLGTDNPFKALRADDIPQIMRDLLHTNEFNHHSIIETLFYLQTRQLLVAITKRVDSHFETSLEISKAEKKEETKQRYILLDDRCSLHCDYYETKAEHDARVKKEEEEDEAEERKKAEQIEAYEREHPYDENEDEEDFFRFPERF